MPQLVKMIGPEPSKFNGMSPRIDEILGYNPITQIKFYIGNNSGQLELKMLINVVYTKFCIYLEHLSNLE